MAGLRQHVPGAHPDENLYATSIMPLGAIFAGGVCGGERGIGTAMSDVLKAIVFGVSFLVGVTEKNYQN